LPGETILVILILIGILGKSNIIATSACILLVLKLTNLQSLYPLLERRGLELGLLFLNIAVLVPFAAERISLQEISGSFLTLSGVLALLGGAIATYMNGQGLNLLQMKPEMMVGLVIGSIVGIIFFKGVPVGPLMAAGVTVFFLKMWELLR